MKSTIYIVPLIFQPVIVTEPGRYRTRSGELVQVETASPRHDFGCIGRYPNGTRERWHKSGRIFAGCLSANDIVGRF